MTCLIELLNTSDLSLKIAPAHAIMISRFNGGTGYFPLFLRVFNTPSAVPVIVTATQKYISSVTA